MRCEIQKPDEWLEIYWKYDRIITAPAVISLGDVYKIATDMLVRFSQRKWNKEGLWSKRRQT